MLTFKDIPFKLFEKITISSLDEISGQITISPKQFFDKAEYSDESMADIKNDIKVMLLTLVYSANPNEEPFLNSLKSDQKKFLIECANSRKLDIALALLKQHNGKIGPVIDSFDWNVKWILGTSSSTTLRYPLFCLDLVTVHYIKDVPNRKNISVEMNKEELQKLISVLEESQALQ